MVQFIIHCIIGIAALAILGYAFSQPLATLSQNDKMVQATDDIYITQECVSISMQTIPSQSTCVDIDPIFKPHMQAIMGIIIVLMICIFFEFIGMNFGMMVSNILGFIVLCLSIALIVLVATLSTFSRGFGTYKLTNTSIIVLVFASLLVLFELCCNKLIHRAFIAPYRMIAGKKA